MPKSLLTGLRGPSPLPLVDVFNFNDEVALLQYRLKLHSPFAHDVLVVESNLTWSGLPKKLVATAALSAEELARYNVQIVNVPFPSGIYMPLTSSSSPLL